MKTKTFWLACAVLAVNLLVPAMGSAAELPAPEASQAEVVLQDLTPQAEVVSPDLGVCTEQQQDETLTLEQLNQMFGANKVCGVRCANTWPRVNCSQVCGDAAGCYNGYCIFL